MNSRKRRTTRRKIPTVTPMRIGILERLDDDAVDGMIEGCAAVGSFVE